MTESLRERLARLNTKAIAGIALLVLLAFALGALLFRGTHPVSAPPRSGEHADHGAKSPTAEVWTCSMHPQIRQSEPGKCPICGMDLIPVVVSDTDQPRADRITLSERAKALAKLRTAEVRRQSDPASEVRLLGRVEPDETSFKTVTAWVAGRIDRLHVRATGEQVRRGQTVATLYSPEVLAAHQDLIAARRQVDRMQEASVMARSAAEAALEAARSRLRLLGVSEERLQALEAESQPTRQIAISTPFAGTVIERLATEGTYVTVGDPLYRIADLTRVWVQLDAYERDLAALSVKQTVTLNVEALAGESFEGRVAFIEPTIDPQRRTARVRIEVANREGRLRPGMFAQALVQGRAATSGERPLVVPHTAPLFTGRRAIVYVEVPEGERPTYEARAVRLGPRAGDFYPVVAGLVEGERIVIRGAFALDADLQIRGGRSMMVGPDDSETGAWDQAIELGSAERNKLRAVFTAYLEVQRALSSDNLTEARRAAESLHESTGKTQLERPPVAREAWPALARQVQQHAQQVSAAKSIEAARGAFEALTLQMSTVLRRFGNPLERPLRIAFCPMTSGGGASWIQEGTVIENPYFGAAMLGCGEFRETLPQGARLPGAAAPAPAAPTPAPGGHQH